MLCALRSVACMAMAMALGTVCGGCTSVTPFEAVLATQPAEEFILLDGQWVHFERAGAGETLVLIHGFGGSTYNWRQVMPSLAMTHDVIAVDLNGFGYTERPIDDAAYTLAGQVSLVQRLLAALEIERATVVGHSYGAGVALGLATRHPQLVSSVVLVSGAILDAAPDGILFSPPLRPLLSCFVQHFLLTEAQVRERLRGAVVDDSLITDEMVRESLARLRVEGVDRALRGLTTQSTDELELDPANIRQPVLLIWGTEDSVIPISVGEGLADELPDARLVRFEVTGHVPMEERPEEFVRVVQNFLY